jgi:hypothetical protein
MRWVLAAFLLLAVNAWAITDADIERAGRRVWQNECGGTRAGLTSWNSGENFASMGIGHFIWYPKGVVEAFDESFPHLLVFYRANGVKLPGWLSPDADCPWNSRAEFLSAFDSAKMNQLRDLLASTVALQSRFLAARMRGSLAKMLAEAPSRERGSVRQNFEKLASTGAGLFALIDYVNFKGEGSNHVERYNLQGWGLLQVLQGMEPGPDPMLAFSRSAKIVLERRVRNSPPARNEAKWLPGWTARVAAYAVRK